MAEAVAPRAPAAAFADAIQAISDWLVSQGLRGGGYESLLDGVCQRLHGGGIPVARAMMAMRTLHPLIDARTMTWRRDGGIEREEYDVSGSTTDVFLQSPLHYILSARRRTELRRRLTGKDAVSEFPVLEELRAAGMTDYVLFKVAFPMTAPGSADTGLLVSWASDAPEGFTEAQVAALRRLAPRLALAVSNRLLREITVNVLDTYVGHDAGQRILRGEIQRGSLREIDAVILYADLRGFTALADRHGGAMMAEMLNEYFECIVPSVVARGGEVLKFLGDGVLATFNLEEQPEDAICRIGLESAVEALMNVDRLNAARRARGEPAMLLDIAMHRGSVMFGNVGAGDRLDFTVIGPAVNEADRLEALAEEVGRHLVISETFACAATQCTDRLVPLGRHTLRDVSTPQEVFTVDY